MATNNKKSLWQYAVMVHTTNKDNEVTDTTLVMEPACMLAKSEAEVLFKVTREIPADKATNPDNVQILVRPF